MLTPDRIKAKTFQTTGKGSYRAEDVDSFLEEVYASYDQAFRENGEIIKKMSILANKVEEYKKDEDSLRQALLSAQKLADQIVSEAKTNAEQMASDAKQQSDTMLADAKAEADKLVNGARVEADNAVHDAKKEASEIIGEVNRKVTQENLVFEMLQKEVSAFRNKMMDMYKEHLTLLDRLPVYVEEQQAAETEKAQEAAPQAQPEESAEEASEEETIEEPVEDEAAPEAETTDETAEAPAEDEDDEEAPMDSDEAADDGFSFHFENIDDTADILDDEPQQADEANIKFVVNPAMFDEDEAFEDVSSGDDEKEAEPTDDEAGDDNFVLDLTGLDLDETVEEEDSAEDEPHKDEYAPADEEPDDDDDDGAISFKSFFKKK